MFIMPMAGKGSAQQWQNNSTLAADLIAAGSFDQAMHVLNRTIGVVNFEPLKPAFISVYTAAYSILPQLPGCSQLTTPLQNFSEDGKSLPVLSLNISQCVDMLKKGYKCVTDGKFSLALDFFTNILQQLPLLSITKKAQLTEVTELRDICREYITAMRLEMAKKTAKTPARAASLAAFFTQRKLQPIHTILSLRVAIKACITIKCYKTTAGLCRRVLDLAVSSNQAALQKVVNFKQIRQALKVCEKENSEAHDLSFDESANAELCANSLTPVPKGQQAVQCPYCGSKFLSKFDGTLCSTCNLSKVGADTTGLKVSNLF